MSYDKFQTLLKERNIKTAKVARDTGIDKSTFANWKSGRYTPKADKIQAIAEYFGVPISYFYGDNTDDVALSSGEKKLLSFYNELSKEGQDLLLERADELIRLGYIKSNKAGMVGA